MQSITVTVHGAPGVVDLAVPDRASVGEIARVYAVHAGLSHPPALCSVAGEPLAAGESLTDAGVAAGAVLVASAGHPAPGPVVRRPVLSADEMRAAAGRDAIGTSLVAVLFAGLATAAAVTAGGGTARIAPVVLLAVAAVLGVLPFGPRRRQRAMLAPVFATAAAVSWWWRSDADELTTTLAAAALAGATTAGLARAVTPEATEGLLVWMAAGVAVFVVVALVNVTVAAAQVSWTALFVLAALAPRSVPALAIVVPDRWLVDLNRFAVAAWSAHDGEEPAAADLSPALVAAIAARGARVVTAAAVATTALATTCAPLLLWSADVRTDQIGALCVVGFGSLALLLSARSYRHRTARMVLRLGGLAGFVALGVRLLAGGGHLEALATVGIATAVFALLLVLLLGRDRPSMWWSRAADATETGAGAIALGAAVVAVGLFRYLWTTVG